jgi:hypothetical protein
MKPLKSCGANWETLTSKMQDAQQQIRNWCGRISETTPNNASLDA